jgi:hypothetical protein
VWQDTIVNLSQISWKQRVFGDEFTLAEFAIDQCDITVLIEFGTAQLQFVAGFDDTSSHSRTIVEEALQRRHLPEFQFRALRGPQPTPKGVIIGLSMSRIMGLPEVYPFMIERYERC